MRLALLTTVWRRPELTRWVLGYYAGLVVEGVTFERVAVVSEGERFPGWDCIDFPNVDLWAKWNAGWHAAREKDVDGVVIMGSDDLLSRRYFERLRDRAPGRMAHMESLHIYDLVSGRLARFEETTTGVGSYCGREVLDEYRNPWTQPMRGQMVTRRGRQPRSLRRGLDGPLKRMRSGGSLLIDAPAVDCKSPENQWSFDFLLRQPKTTLCTAMEAAAFWQQMETIPPDIPEDA